MHSYVILHAEEILPGLEIASETDMVLVLLSHREQRLIERHGLVWNEATRKKKAGRKHDRDVVSR